MQSTCDAIDSSLKYKRILKPSSVLVYQVEREGQLYVLKISVDRWDRRHLQNEQKILSHCEEIEGVTHLIQCYQQKDGYPKALLKEYAEGEMAHRCFDRSTVFSSLEKTVQELHGRGIAGLELEPRNVIVLKQMETKIVDLGKARIYQNIMCRSFRDRVDGDLYDLENWFT